jgi:photosystem II stability/assembly factor-like uncharacterized protein
MIRLIRYCFLCALVFSCLAQEGYSVWNKVGQFNDAISCGYFFDADNGIIGLGHFERGVSTFISDRPLLIFWTNNGGKNWNQSVIPPGGTGRVTSIFMKNRYEGYASIYSRQYSIWKTIDGGKSWTDFSQGNTDFTTCIYQTDKSIIRTIWFGLPGGSSTDGGRSYSQIFYSNRNGSNGVDFVDENFGVATMGPGGGTWITADGGITWNIGGDIPEAWSIYALKGTRKFFALPEDQLSNDGNIVYQTIDAGATWIQKFLFKTFPRFTGHIAGAGSTLYVQTDDNTNLGLFRSDDLGATWTNVGGPSNSRDTRFVVTGCRGEVVYAFDNNGGVYKTTDGGDGAFGFTPRIGNIASVKAGDTTLIPIYIDSTGAPFSISQLSGNLMLNRDLLTPVGFETKGTVSKNISFDTLYVAADKSVNFQVKYSKPLKNGIPLSQPIIFIKAVAYVTTTDTTSVILNSLDVISGSTQVPLIVCSATSNTFTLANECSDSSLRQFMKTGDVASLLSINPNPSSSNSIEAKIYLSSESDVAIDLIDTYGTYRSYKTYGTYASGIQKLHINTAGLSSGEYFLQIHLNSGSLLSGHVVICR